MNDSDPLRSHSRIGRLVGPDRGWIGTQIVLLAIGTAGGLAEVAPGGRAFTVGSSRTSILLGGVLIVAATAVLAKATADLAGNVTMSPTPVKDGELVERGIYAHVRHPMYLAVLLGMAGFALAVGSWIALAVSAALVPFFTAKAHHEERALESRYPGYAGYRRRVPSRFIPWIW